MSPVTLANDAPGQAKHLCGSAPEGKDCTRRNLPHPRTFAKKPTGTGPHVTDIGASASIHPLCALIRQHEAGRSRTEGETSERHGTCGLASLRLVISVAEFPYSSAPKYAEVGGRRGAGGQQPAQFHGKVPCVCVDAGCVVSCRCQSSEDGLQGGVTVEIGEMGRFVV